MPRARLVLLGALLLTAGCGPASATGAGAAEPTLDIPRRTEAYDLDRVEDTLADLRHEAEQSPDEREDWASRARLVRARAELLLVAFAAHDVELVQALARDDPGGARCRTEGEQIGPGCLPGLLAHAAEDLRAARVDEALAELLEAVASSWRSRGGELFSAVRVAWQQEGIASTAAAAVVAALGPAVLEAIEAAGPEATLTIVAKGLPLECPAVLPELPDTPPEERPALLARGKCLPLCPQAVDALAMQPADADAELDVRSCSPASLGLVTPFGRDMAALNMPAWTIARAMDWLARARMRLEQAPDAVGRTLVASGFTEQYGERLAQIHLPVPPPGRIPFGSGGRIDLPPWPAQLAWAPAPLYALVREGELSLGRAPAVVIGEDGARISGTPLPGTAVEPTEADAELQLEGEGPVADAFRKVASELTEAAGELEEPAVMLLADGDEPAQRVVQAASAIEREVSASVNLAVRGRQQVGVLRIPVVDSAVERAQRGESPEPERWVLLHLAEDGPRLSGPGTTLPPVASDDPEALAEALRGASRKFPDVELLRLSVGEGVSYAALVRAVHVAAGTAEAPFAGLRLAPTGMEPR